MRQIYERRICILFVTTFIAFAAIVGRLYLLQVVQSPVLQMAANKQQMKVIGLEEDIRGQIRDRTGADLLGSRLVTKALVLPRQLEQPEGLASQLSKVFGLKTLEARAMLQGDPHLLPFVIDDLTKQKLLTYQGKGLELVTLETRYGGETIAANLIGHLGLINSSEELEDFQHKEQKEYSVKDKVGRKGLELLYESELKGTRPKRSIQLMLDAQGRVIKGLSKQELQLGADPLRQHVVTTLDKELQILCERILKQKDYAGAIVVLDTHSGDVLACASTPTYRPDQLPQALAQGEKVFLDRTRCLYPPGSVFKVLTTAAALEEGVISESTTLPCPGQAVLKCDEQEQHEYHTLREAFAHSRNTFFINLGYRLGEAKVVNYAKRLGLDNQAILGYSVKPDKRQRWDLISQKYNLSNSFIGQGSVLVTPLQVSAMMAAVANGGLYYQPRLVSSLVNDTGTVTKILPSSQPQRVLAEVTTQKLRSLLKTAVKDGTGNKAWLDGVGSAGKTGSAQMGNGTTLCWFSGFFPVDKPQYVITVVVEDGESGGTTSAPLFKAVADYILKRGV